MVKIEIGYEGELHCSATHTPSGATLATDAPVDNEGRGASFSPTDLVATALGTCMATTMGIAAKRKGIALEGMALEVQKEMTSAAPRAIAALRTRIEIPLAPDHPDRPLLEAAALGCPVHRSLHPDVAKPVEFVWKG
jgi:putative redox protein